MNENYSYQIRLTGVLVKSNKILIVKQKLSDKRGWSLPGGRLEHGETIEQGILREMLEETGLVVQIDKLLYVCDGPNAKRPIIHITFLLNEVSGSIQLPTNEFDDNPITDVKFAAIEDLHKYGFSDKFVELALQGFSNNGTYMGNKNNIGLGI